MLATRLNSTSLAPRPTPRLTKYCARAGSVTVVIRAVTLAVIATAPAPVTAQRSVRTLASQAQAGIRLRLLVDPVAGASGDSIEAIVARDIAYGSRVDVVRLSELRALVASSDGLAGNIGLLKALPTARPPATLDAQFAASIPMLRQLGVDGAIHLQGLPDGVLRVDVMETATNSRVRTQSFRVSGAMSGAMSGAVSNAMSGAVSGAITGAASGVTSDAVYDAEWRMSLHAVADAIIEWIAGEAGTAASRVAYVRENRIWIVDSDGANAHPVTARGLSPKWTPDGHGLVYNILDFTTSPIMFVDLATRAERAITSVRSSAGQDFAAIVAPDGKTVFFTRSSAYSAEIFSIPIHGGKPTRLTSSGGRASNSPTLSPDGHRMAFMSDRTGRPDTFVADIDGANARVLTTAGVAPRDWRTNPDWSPDGRFVAYQSGRGTQWQVMVVDVRDGTSHQITYAGSNFDPSWGPNARQLVVTSSRGGQQLWVVEVATGATRQLTLGGTARGPAWSPVLRMAERAF
jgi:tol-pal system beta propeller repeat protein TolB